MKYLLAIIFILSIREKSFSQDYESIFQKIHSHYITNDSASLIILLSSTDCFKCKLPLSRAMQIINEPNFKNRLQKIIISDNYALAKKFDKENNFNAKIIYDKDIFDSLPDGLKSCIIISVGKKNKVIGSKEVNSEMLRSELNTFLSKSSKISLSFPDSLINHNFFSCAASKFGFIIFDELMQEGVIINYDNKQEYLKPSFDDSAIINNLGDRVDKTIFSKISYVDALKRLSENDIPILHINSVSNFGNNIFIVFSINRCYKDKRHDDDYGIFTTNFIAKKEIKSFADFNSIFNLSTYQYIYYIDSFTYNEKIYPTGKWMNFRPQWENDSTFNFNVNYQNDEEKKIQFGGLATIVLKKDNKTQMVKLNKNAKEEIFINNVVEYNGMKYKLYKQTTNDSLNAGIINIEEEK